jgi:L-lysine exporter family protein LysE/ArgO
MFIFINGLMLGFSLIMALGPQNLFLIKQGARKNHAWLSATVCFFCDLILATASVAGLHELLELNASLKIWMIGLGSVFLLYYALKALKNVLTRKNQINDSAHKPHSKLQIILFALGFSILNPHAIIDTLVIIGSGSSQFPDNQWMFLLGVITSSFLWFSSLTLATLYFSKLLTRGIVWHSIELLSALLMGTIGIKLALSEFISRVQ